MQWWHGLIVVVASASLSGLATYGVAWLNRKGAKEVQASTAQLENRSLDQQLIDRMQTQIDKQDERMARLIVRVDELEQALDREERGRAAAIRYIRRLLDWIAEHLPNHTPPEIPLILREDLT